MESLSPRGLINLRAKKITAASAAAKIANGQISEISMRRLHIPRKGTRMADLPNPSPSLPHFHPLRHHPQHPALHPGAERNLPENRAQLGFQRVVLRALQPQVQQAAASG